MACIAGPPGARSVEERRERARAANERRAYERRFHLIPFAADVRDLLATGKPGFVKKLRVGQRTISVVAPSLNLAWLRENVGDTGEMRMYLIQAAEISGDTEGAAAVVLAADSEIRSAAFMYLNEASVEIKRHHRTLAKTFDPKFVRQQRVIFTAPRPQRIPRQGRARTVRRHRSSAASRTAARSGSPGRATGGDDPPPGEPPPLERQQHVAEASGFEHISTLIAAELERLRRPS